MARSVGLSEQEAGHAEGAGEEGRAERLGERVEEQTGGHVGSEASCEIRGCLLRFRTKMRYIETLKLKL